MDRSAIRYPFAHPRDTSATRYPSAHPRDTSAILLPTSKAFCFKADDGDKKNPLGAGTAETFCIPTSAADEFREDVPDDLEDLTR